MSEPIKAEATHVYYHDCPALGPHTRVPQSTMMSTDGTVVLGWQHKCPFCSHTANQFEPAPGVTVTGDHQYSVDMTKAIKVEGSQPNKGEES